MYYKDGTQVYATFFLNGVEPVRIHSVAFNYSNTEAWWQLPDAEIYQVNNPDNKLLLPCLGLGCCPIQLRHPLILNHQ